MLRRHAVILQVSTLNITQERAVYKQIAAASLQAGGPESETVSRPPPRRPPGRGQTIAACREEQLDAQSFAAENPPETGKVYRLTKTGKPDKTYWRRGSSGLWRTD
jgi:hypothetical protein